MRYLEYLTVKCNVPDKNLHTDLGCIYVRCVAKLIKKSTMNYEELKNNEKIADLKMKLREFLSQSLLYEALEIEMTMRPATEDEQVSALTEKLLVKERALLKMRMKKFRDCFELCIEI